MEFGGLHIKEMIGVEFEVEFVNSDHSLENLSA